MGNPTEYRNAGAPGNYPGQAPRVGQRRQPAATRPAGSGGRRGNSSTLLVVILTVLVIIVIALGAYLIFGNDKGSKTQGDEKSEQTVAGEESAGEEVPARERHDGRVESAKPGFTTYSVGGVRFNMRNVDGGSFEMGATYAQQQFARDEEYPSHYVTLSDYKIGETEVTQGLWRAVMGSNPSRGVNSDDRPVNSVSYNEIREFISRLNSMTGESFRLPTEAEWEFAARGGNEGASTDYVYSGSDVATEVGWVKSNSGGEVHPVAQLRPNQLGLYDMTGNVFEFVSDPYGNYSGADQTNPRGSGSGRVGRGGGYSHASDVARVSRRTRGNNTQADASLGFRLAR